MRRDVLTADRSFVRIATLEEPVDYFCVHGLFVYSVRGLESSKCVCQYLLSEGDLLLLAFFCYLE